MGGSGCRIKPRFSGGQVGLGPGGGWHWWFWPHRGDRGVWEERHVGPDLGLPGPIRAGRAPRGQHQTGQARSPRVGLRETGRVCSTERVCVCMGTCVLACAVEEFYVCAGEHVCMCVHRVCVVGAWLIPAVV